MDRVLQRKPYVVDKGQVEQVVDEVGFDKAPRVLVKRGLCVSRAEARRETHWLKIERGHKQPKDIKKGDEE